MSLRFPKVRLPRRASGCRSCGNAIEPDQLACLECGALQGSGARLGGAAWKMPVALVGALLLLMATGFGFASGAVGRDGEVTVAQAPPATPSATPPGQPGPAEEEGAGSGSGGSALPKLPSPNLAGSGRKLGFGGGGGSTTTLDDSFGGGSSDEASSGSGGGGSSVGNASPNRGGGGSSTSRTTPDPTPSEPSLGPARTPRRLAAFPKGSGFVVILKSSSSRDVALREAQSAAGDGLKGVGIVASADAPGLPSGRYFAFAGPIFSSRTEAERFVGNNVSPIGYSGTVMSVGAGSGPTG